MRSLPPVVERLIATAGLVVLFAAMASVIVPDWTQAEVPEAVLPNWTVESVDPHEGLRSLGTLEDDRFTVNVFASDEGPLYSIYSAETGEVIGILLTPEQVERQFPDLPLPQLDFSATGPVMLADTPDLDGLF